MMLKNLGNISPSLIHRLPTYLIHVQELLKQKIEWVSSDELAKALDLTSSTIRQDFSCLDCSGISKKGYNVQFLETCLLKILGIEYPINVAIVGAGNLGHALALHEGFIHYQFIICAIFDINPEIIGKRIGKIIIQGMDSLKRVIRQKKIKIGIISVPYLAAQDVADRLIDAGIQGILSFSSVHLNTPRNIPVVNSRIVTNLLEISFMIRNVQQNTNEKEKES